MAVMAREFGIASRIAVGYAPGTPTAEVGSGRGDIERLSKPRAGTRMPGPNFILRAWAGCR